jgi:hypothetical protein
MSTELIQEAQRIIGTGKEGDYLITPTKDADEFKGGSAEFAQLLRSGKVGIAAKDYEEKDRAATEAKQDFQRIFQWSNRTVFLTSTTIVLVLLMGIVAPEWKIVMIGLGLLSFVGGFIASYYLNVLKQGRLLDNWMSNRARAEAARLEYFVCVAKCADTSQLGPLMDLLRLEYFRRFQLDVQVNFYVSAIKRHIKEARQGLKLSSIAVAGAGIITAFAGFASGFISAKFAAVATLGSFFTAISSYASTREDVYHHQRNAERYSRTKDALTDIYKTIDDVRTAVLKDGQKPLLDFIDAVHEQLLAEHKQWLSLEEESENAFTKLQDTLRQSLSTLPSVDGKLPIGGKLPDKAPAGQKTQPAGGQKALAGGKTATPGGQTAAAGGQTSTPGG